MTTYQERDFVNGIKSTVNSADSTNEDAVDFVSTCERRLSRSGSSGSIVPRRSVFSASINSSEDLISGRRPSNVSGYSKVSRARANSVSSKLETDLLSPMIRFKSEGLLQEEPEKSLQPEQDLEVNLDEIHGFIRQEIQESDDYGTSSWRRATGVHQFREESTKAAIKYTPKFSKSFLRSNGRSLPLQKVDSTRAETASCQDTSGEGSEDHQSDEILMPKTASIASESPESLAPDRFSYFNTSSHNTFFAPDMSSLQRNGSIESLFGDKEGVWWLDCISPTDAEMRMFVRAFGLHPLTAEDIRTEESREKVELFRNYYFVSFHSFEANRDNHQHLQQINMYIVVFKQGILTFHTAPLPHACNIRRRVSQLKGYVQISADWLCYALVDDITDGFAPEIKEIEHHTDAIEESVFVARDQDFGFMLKRICAERKSVMALMRLLVDKADVIKSFTKRCQEDANRRNKGKTDEFGVSQPRSGITLYLGDIQDHIVTMYQNLASYEKILSRSHANYLAQLQVESFKFNNEVTEMFNMVTVIGTVIMPLNVIASIFGMNVHVPGDDQPHNIRWFWGILGVMAVVAISLGLFVRIWFNPPRQNQGTHRSQSILLIWKRSMSRLWR